jgi:hypothetical protein
MKCIELLKRKCPSFWGKNFLEGGKSKIELLVVLGTDDGENLDGAEVI